MNDADTICKHQESLAAVRSNWDSFWDTIAQRVMPASATFQSRTEEGQSRTDRVFDSTAVIANERFGAFISEGLTPRDQFWHDLAPEDEDLSEDEESKEFLERIRKYLFTCRYRPYANFNSQRQECYTSLGAFGNYALFIDEDLVRGMRYRCVPMREVFWSENHQGHIDMLYRRFELQARQAAQRANSEGWQLPAKIIKDATDNPFKPYEFIHCVRPNEERTTRPDYTGMQFASYYVALEGKTVVSRGGYRVWPYAIGRFMKAPGETYGRSPAMSAFPSIMTVNEQKKTVLRSGQKAVDPPLLLMEDGALEAFNSRASALNYGMLNAAGEPLVRPLDTGGKVELGIELMALEQKAINDAFMVSLFQILNERPDMTATEVMARLQEKASLLSPATGRLESEDLGPLIEREIDIIAHRPDGRWIIEEMPDQLRERGGAYKQIYTSPLSRARRASDALAITRTMEIQTVAMGIDPRAKHVMNIPQAMREVADINGVPAKLLRTSDEIEELSADEEQQQQLAAAAQLAPGVAGAAKDIAQADQIRGAV